MKTVELTEREQTILLCLIGIDDKTRQMENLRLEAKNERWTKEEIEKYDRNIEIMNELSILTKN